MQLCTCTVHMTEVSHLWMRGYGGAISMVECKLALLGCHVHIRWILRHWITDTVHRQLTIAIKSQDCTHNDVRTATCVSR